MLHLIEHDAMRGAGVVAVSGGADSVALLRSLAALSKPLIVGHVNHQLRGSESDADEQFVRELARSLGLPFHSTRVNIPRDTNLEAAARNLRYEWLQQVAVESSATWIATGHTADDQAETVLHRLIRGTGIQGLRGIARSQELQPGMLLIRPLLETSREQIIAYLQSLPQDWREDRTNEDRTFTRNRIRHELLPLLRTFNPAISEVLIHLADQAATIHEERQGPAQELLERAELPMAGPLRIFDHAILNAAADAPLRDMFRLVWQRENWPCGGMTFEHWQRLVDMVHGKGGPSDFPGGIIARVKNRVVQIGPRAK